MRPLSELLPESQIVQPVHGSVDARIASIVCDSRLVTRGALFVARPGSKTDGQRFIADAIARGAVAILHADPLDTYDDRVTYMRVKNAHRALSLAAARFYGYPAREMCTIGVTGTDGKSTTVYLLYQLLNRLGRRAGFISTVASSVGGEIEPNPFHQSTPEAPQLQAALRRMVNNGCRYAVLEATSHGLSLRTCRLADIDFHVAIFTNLGHDHLEFHGSHEHYRDDKANLFRALDHSTVHNQPRGLPDAAYSSRTNFGVVNAADHASSWMRHATTAPIHSYALVSGDSDSSAWPGSPDLLGYIEQADPAGSRLRLTAGAQQVTLDLPLPGAFNAANALAALLALQKIGDYSLAGLCDAAAALKLPDGRLQTICAPPERPFRVIVDYAHTPLAFKQLLPWIKGHTDGRLLALFGSAGERDRAKRPLLGEIAARYADIIILTDEDPRGEPAAAIRAEIAAGAYQERPMLAEEGMLFDIGDRRAAIRSAVALLRAGDSLLLLGKGHEHSIIYADYEEQWDEAAEIRAALAIG